MTRDELIEMGAQALHRLNPEEYQKPLDERHDGDAEHLESAAVIGAVDPIIRAAERERYLKAQAETGQMVSTLSYDLSEARITLTDLQDALEDVINQACSVYNAEEEHLDSMALSAYAHGMRVLAKRGRITIEHEYGRRVIGRWVEE